MTESEWFNCNDVAPMFNWLNHPLSHKHLVYKEESRSIERKYRLFAIACCNRVIELIKEPEIRYGLELVEAYCEDLVDEKGLADQKIRVVDARRYVNDATVWRPNYAATLCLNETKLFDPIEVAYNCSSSKILSVHKEREEQADLLRDIIGNPFKKFHRFSKDGQDSRDFMTPDVIFLRNSAYFEKNPLHTLDPEKLLLLADALEEAGLPSKKCEKCEGTGEIMTVGGNYLLESYCTFCGGRGKYKAKNSVKGRGITPNPILAALRGWEICKKCLGTGVISIVNLPTTRNDGHPCSNCYGSALGRGWVYNDRPKYKGFWALDLVMEKK